MSGFFRTTSTGVSSPGDTTVATVDGEISFDTGDPSTSQMLIENDGDVLIGTSGTAVSKLTVEGVLSLEEQAVSPSITINYGKLYAKTDNQLYFLDDAGVETQLTSAGGGAPIGGGWTDDGGTVRLTAGTDNVGIGTSTTNEKLTLEGVLSMDEVTAPSTTVGYGKLYVSSADNSLHFLDSSGTDYNLLAVGVDNFADMEPVGGTQDGANKSFTIANPPIAGSVHFYWNGVLQLPGAGNDYTISGQTILMVDAPQSDDVLLASYRY